MEARHSAFRFEPWLALGGQGLFLCQQPANVFHRSLLLTRTSRRAQTCQEAQSLRHSFSDVQPASPNVPAVLAEGVQNEKADAGLFSTGSVCVPGSSCSGHHETW